MICMKDAEGRRNVASGGQPYCKCGPLARLAVGPNGSTVILDNLAANSQPNARACKLSFAMQPLEHLENAFGILLIKADPVILNS